MEFQELLQEINALAKKKREEGLTEEEQKRQKELYAITDRWRQRPGRAVITVLHDLSAARRFATHALVLREGAPLAFAAAKEALSDSNLRAAWDMDVAEWMREMGKSWDEEEG